MAESRGTKIRSLQLKWNYTVFTKASLQLYMKVNSLNALFTFDAQMCKWPSYWSIAIMTNVTLENNKKMSWDALNPGPDRPFVKTIGVPVTPSRVITLTETANTSLTVHAKDKFVCLPNWVFADIVLWQSVTETKYNRTCLTEEFVLTYNTVFSG